MNRETIAKTSAVVITIALVAILLSFANKNNGDEYGNDKRKGQIAEFFFDGDKEDGGGCDTREDTDKTP